MEISPLQIVSIASATSEMHSSLNCKANSCWGYKTGLSQAGSTEQVICYPSMNCLAGNTECRGWHSWVQLWKPENNPKEDAFKILRSLSGAPSHTLYFREEKKRLILIQNSVSSMCFLLLGSYNITNVLPSAPDIAQFKQGVKSVAGKLSVLANGVMTSIQVSKNVTIY